MKTAVKTDCKSKIFCISKNYTLLKEKETGYFDLKSYQKLFVFFTSLSIFLIIPESPRELEYVCENYNSSQLCNVW